MLEKRRCFLFLKRCNKISWHCCPLCAPPLLDTFIRGFASAECDSALQGGRSGGDIIDFLYFFFVKNLLTTCQVFPFLGQGRGHLGRQDTLPPLMQPVPVHGSWRGQTLRRIRGNPGGGPLPWMSAESQTMGVARRQMLRCSPSQCRHGYIGARHRTPLFLALNDSFALQEPRPGTGAECELPASSLIPFVLGNFA